MKGTDMAEGARPEILIIDDDPHVIDALRRTLLDQPWRVRRAGSTDEALAILEGHTIDVVLCDYYLPGMDGLEILRMIHDRFPQVARILLTGSVQTAPIETALHEELLHGYQKKPWDDEGLIAQIHQFLQREEAPGTPDSAAYPGSDVPHRTVTPCALPDPRDALYRAVLDLLPFGVIGVNQAGQIHFANQRARARIPAAGPGGPPISDVFDAATRQAIRQALEEDHVSEGLIEVGEIRLCPIRAGHHTSGVLVFLAPVPSGALENLTREMNS